MFSYFMVSVLFLCLGIQYIVLNRLEKLETKCNSFRSNHDVKDGTWTLWEPWESCSATCGGGIRSRTRTCSDPPPSSGGKFCDGEAIQYGPCRQTACPCEELTSKIDSLDSRRTKVAFTAYLSKPATQLSISQIIPFDRVILNEGQNFNTNTHIFTCPVAGTYIFQTGLLSTAHSLVLTEIVKEGVRLVQAHAEPGAAAHNQGFNSVVTKCDKGENVWVRIDRYGNAVHSERYATFSGFLLWENR